MNEDVSAYPNTAAPTVEALLNPDEPAPFRIENAQGRSGFVLIGDHAGRLIPRALGGLGLPDRERERHIGWDIGIAGLGSALAVQLDSVFISQPYSRLVIDCNRHPDDADAVVALSDGTRIAANENLEAAQIQARVRSIHAPYHAQITQALDAREAHGQPSVLVLLHSFTPVYAGFARPWHVGVLYHRDTRLATALLQQLRAQGDLVVGDNEPYSATDDADYALPVHGETRGLLHVELEIRQDLITTAKQQHHWAQRLAAMLTQALADVQSRS